MLKASNTVGQITTYSKRQKTTYIEWVKRGGWRYLNYMQLCRSLKWITSPFFLFATVIQNNQTDNSNIA